MSCLCVTSVLIVVLKNKTCFSFHSKDPAGSEVAMVGEKNYTGIITFPDFKIPFNPKYLFYFILFYFILFYFILCR